MRGNQYAKARSNVAGGNPNGENRARPLAASTTNSGTVSSAPHKAVQVACEARA